MPILASKVISGCSVHFNSVPGYFTSMYQFLCKWPTTYPTWFALSQRWETVSEIAAEELVQSLGDWTCYPWITVVLLYTVVKRCVYLWKVDQNSFHLFQFSVSKNVTWQMLTGIAELCSLCLKVILLNFFFCLCWKWFFVYYQENACKHATDQPNYMASPQCLQNSGRRVTEDMCFPSTKEVLRSVCSTF